jgi:hypothetical protein
MLVVTAETESIYGGLLSRLASEKSQTLPNNQTKSTGGMAQAVSGESPEFKP